MKKFIIPALCILLSGPAFAESLGEKTGVDSLMGISPSTTDFVKEAADDNMFEIQSSQLAEQKSIDPQTKAFAERMIKDHSMIGGELKTLVDSGKVKAPLPDQLDSAHQSMLDKLKGLAGSDFAKAFHDDQDGGHKDAVSLFKRYAAGGDNSDLKAWATKTLPTLEAHLKMAETLDQSKPAKTVNY